MDKRASSDTASFLRDHRQQSMIGMYIFWLGGNDGLIRRMRCMWIMFRRLGNGGGIGTGGQIPQCLLKINKGNPADQTALLARGFVGEGGRVEKTGLARPRVSLHHGFNLLLADTDLCGDALDSRLLPHLPAARRQIMTIYGQEYSEITHPEPA